MKIKPVYFINIVLTASVLIGNYFYQLLDFFYPLKMFCSGGFMLQGIINFGYFLKQKNGVCKVPLFLTLGIIFSFGGDAAINWDFVIGAGIFALGHVFFVIAYFIYRKLNRRDMILCASLGLFSVAFISFFPLIEFEVEAFRSVCLIYAFIISVMVGKAVGNAVSEPSLFTNVIAASSILFFVSDFMLLLAWFSSVTGWTSNVCMALYYPAMCLFAGSIIIYTRESK